jgi:hypothetical protein
VAPAHPTANMQKYMMYIAPFFALSGLYWQFGLVIYWVTTNVWTLGQQHVLFRNLPIVGSATVDASADQAATGTVSGKTGSAGKATSSGGKAAAITGKTSSSGRTSGSAKSAAQNAGANGANGATAGSARGLLRFGKNKPEPEPVPSAPQGKVVRQQPVRQTRSKRSGNSGKR